MESAAGVGVGGRTGLTAVVCGSLFLLSMFFTPLVGLIPSAATAPALIIVGALMMESVRNIDFTRFHFQVFPGFYDYYSDAFYL